jgi:hypothetical protein
MPKLLITTNRGTTEFTLDRESLTIGRSSNNDIVIDDPVVSRQHARLERTHQGYKIVDLGSANGLKYNKLSFTEKTLEDGDVLWISDTISLTYKAPVADTVPEKEQVSVSIPDSAGTSNIWQKMVISRRWVTVWLCVLVIVLIGGFLYGFYFLPVDEPGGSAGPADSQPAGTTASEPQYISADQRSVLAELGQPPSWILVDGPVEGSDEVQRVESWIYPDADTMCSFIDGRLTERSEVSLEPAEQNNTSEIRPGDLTGDMTLAEVRSLLDEDGELVEPVEIEGYPDCVAYHFPENGLVISFLDDGLFTAQTYVYMSEEE